MIENALKKLLCNEKLNRTLFFVALFSVEYLATTSRHIEIVESMWDKFNHFFAFGVLFVLLSFGYVGLRFWQKGAMLLLFGVQIEVVQSFLPARSFSLFDVVADTVGIAIGALVFVGLKKYIVDKP